MSLNKSIGGYFELETPYFNGHYHKEIIKLNTARNAFEYVLRANNFSKVYIPYFICDVLFEPLEKLNVNYEFYYIDSNLEPKFNYTDIKKDEVFLYINYFGIKNKFIYSLTSKTTNVIIDNSQAFYNIPPKNIIASFYSARKFFGVADGAYLYTSKILDNNFEQDISSERMKHLLKRIEYGATNAYSDFIKDENSLIEEPIKKMSKITDKLLSSIPYDEYLKIRNNNFYFLHNKLKSYNKLKIKDDIAAPLCYPFWIKNGIELKEILIKNKIFTPTFWKSVLKFVSTETNEHNIVNNLVPIPIDQRYNTKDMQKITNIIKKHLNYTK